VFFRVGGAAPGRTGTALVINSDHVLLDHVRVWRAARGGNAGTAAHGVVVNGDDVRAAGLTVAHFPQQQGVVWNGARGRTVAARDEPPLDERPYDEPSLDLLPATGTRHPAASATAGG
jgi:hypothetical protein